ncbi:glycosyltransferase [Candidatus Micrarchaeota archaeon]|nr:glycosyltransferase [Candidatus Micrarchaeota archaeon]
MKVLVIAQEIDEEGSILGFFVEWVRKLSQHFEELDVAYFKGNGARMPKNVNLHRIEGNRASKVLKLNELILGKKPDRVFVHMCPEFVVAIGAICRAKGIPIIFWRASGWKSKTLDAALLFSSKILTSTPQGFPKETEKKKVLCQGIDNKKYKPLKEAYLLDVARLSGVKHHDVIIKSVAKLKKEYPELELWVAGGKTESEPKLKAELVELAEETGIGNSVKFLGSVPHSKMPNLYSNCIIFISASTTGSLDKTGLEAMASEKPVLVCNKAFSEVLEGYEERLFFRPGDVGDLAEKMDFLLKGKQARKRIGKELRKRVDENHSLDSLISKIATEIKTTR